MVNNITCSILETILNELIAPKHVGIIKSFECIIVSRSFIDEDYYISVIMGMRFIEYFQMMRMMNFVFIVICWGLGLQIIY
jgi:hypothetical protein